MGRNPTSARLATLGDVAAITETVAAAFASDPAWSFILGPGQQAARRTFARTLLIPRLRHATAWVTDDCSAVAMWDRLGTDTPATEGEDSSWASFREEVGDDTWRRLQAYDAALEAVGPSRPFWYLGVLATHPDHQRCGLATAVLEPGLEKADTDGWDCWLETSTPANKAFYAGRGFTAEIPVDIPGGPPTWWLCRPTSTRRLSTQKDGQPSTVIPGTEPSERA